MPIAPIVAGTDGSATAERAITKAGELAAALDATLHIVTSFDARPTVAWVAGAELVSGVALAEEARTWAEEIVLRTQRRLAETGVRSETHVATGDPANALITVAEGVGAQMIVVGNRGMIGTRRVLGSVPNRVSHHARCCVLIVPTD